MPWLFLTAIPNLSQSGSVPITISAFVCSAISIAILSASGSSGFGEITVGKSPSGVACCATTCTFVYPAASKTRGIMVIEVPCSAVKTIFRSFLAFAGVL